MADGGLDKKRQQFEDAQLKELAVPVDTTKIEEVLASAEAVGMISKDVVKKITDDKSLSAALGSSFAKTFGNAEKAAMSSLENDSSKTEAEKAEIARAKAFREAFRMVYGRFMLENKSEPTSDQVVLDKLKSALKFEIDEYGLKTRPELQAAIHRLKLNAAARWKKVKGVRITEAETEKSDLAKKKAEAKTQLDKMNDLNALAGSFVKPLNDYESATQSDGTTDDIDGKIDAVNKEINDIKVEIDSVNAEIDSIKVEIDSVDAEISSTNAQIGVNTNEINNLKRELAAAESLINVDGVLNSELVTFFTAFEVDSSLLGGSNSAIKNLLSLSSDKLYLLSVRMQTDQLFARKVLGIGAEITLTKDVVKAGLKKLRSTFHSDKFPEFLNDKENKDKLDLVFKMGSVAEATLLKSIKNGDINPINDHFAECQTTRIKIESKKNSRSQLEAKLNSRKKYRADELVKKLEERMRYRDGELNSNLGNKEADKATLLSDKSKVDDKDKDRKLAEITNLFESFNEKIVLIVASPDVSEAVKNLCNKYLSEYQKWIASKDRNVNSVVNNFYEKIFKVFLSDLNTSLSADVNNATEGLTKIDLRIDQFQRDVIPEDIFDEILAKAFPKAASGAEIKGYERRLHEAEHAEHHLQDVYKYFSTAENIKKVSTSYHDLKTLVAGAEIDDKENSLNRRISKYNQEIKGKTAKRDSLAKAKTQGAKAEEDNRLLIDTISGEISVAEEKIEQLNEIRTLAKAWKADLSKLVENLEGAHHAGIHVDFKSAKLKDIAAKLKAINPSSGNFNPSTLIEVYEMFGGFFENHHHEVDHLLESFDKASAAATKTTKDSKKALEKANAAVEKSKGLTDADASKRIIGALVGEQFPDMSPMDHNKLVTMILAEDVATLQTDEGYEALAQRGTAEAMETAKFANVRKRLLNFKYKEGDKVTQPLKGIKPDDLKDWESIEKLFTFGKLNYKNAFFVLVAFQDFDGDVKSIQSVKLEKKLKTLLAKQMGVDAHMDKAGISKVVDDAFKAQMEKIKPIMKAHFSTVDTKGDKAKENKKKVLDMKYEDLNDQFKSGKISGEIYDHKLEALVKEAKEADVDVEFSADSVGSKYWNSPHAQWLKDKLHDTGSFVGKKALAAGVFAPLKIAGKGVWGATKLGTALGFQTALLPVRAAKYPLLLAAKPIVGFINLFRANKWTPLPGLRDSVKNDTARIMGYAKEKATGVAKGTAETVTGTVSGEWGKVKYAGTKYADRNKKKADERAELMKIYEPKSDLEAIEVPDSPFVDLAKYKKQIDMVATALGIKIEAPHGAEVKVGHEEKKDDHAKPHDAAHGAHDAHAEKKEEHGHGHEEKKDAHAKPEDHAKPAHH